MTKQEMNNKIIKLEQQIAELKEQLNKKDYKMPVGEIWKPENKASFTIYSSNKPVLEEAIDFVGEDNVKKYILEINE